MSEIDLRDIGGRARRLAIACVLGMAASIGMAYWIPRRRRWSGCLSGPDDINVALVLAGATALALLIYTALAVVAAHRSRRLPRAILIARRS